MENIYVKLSRHTRLETDRLVLRPVTLDDAPAMFEYASDEENTRYTFETNKSLEETRNNIALWSGHSRLASLGGLFHVCPSLHKVPHEKKSFQIFASHDQKLD